MSGAKNKEITFELVEHIGVFGKEVKGWTKELNRVSWNGGPAKYDLRSWDEDHIKMGRGITMTKQEVIQLKSLFDKIN